MYLYIIYFDIPSKRRYDNSMNFLEVTCVKLTWLREYRPLVETIIGLFNSYNQICNAKVFCDESGKILLSATEVQIIEYILENEERNENMSAVAQRLSISQSTFSKKIKHLVQMGLLERYCTVNNRKNIVIKVSDAGKRFYLEYVESHQIDAWKEMFKQLDNLDNESVEIFINALNILRKSMQQTVKTKAVSAPGDLQLIRLD